MSHQRTAIRHKVIELLTREPSPGTWPTMAESRVNSTRVTPYWESELPAINVYNGTDRADVFNQAPRQLRHDFSLIVECVADALADGLDDTLDAMAREVERVISINDTLEGEAADILLNNTEITIRENGDKFIGAARMEFRVEYYTNWPDAVDLELDNFETTDVQYDLNNQAEADRAKDIIEVEQ
jgi:hypothetical protein